MLHNITDFNKLSFRLFIILYLQISYMLNFTDINESYMRIEVCPCVQIIMQ